MCGALLRRSRPNTNSPLLRLHTKDKSVRFCFKLLFFVQKTTNFTELLQQLILLIYEAKLLISVLELYSEENLI